MLFANALTEVLLHLTGNVRTLGQFPYMERH
jgi:hypothetical protein